MSALINPTTLALAAAVLAIALAPAASARAWIVRAAARLSHPAVLAAILAIVGANLLARAAIGHVAPGDFMQEIVAASSFGERATLYPRDVNGEALRWLAGHPPPLLSRLPGLLRDPLIFRREQGRNRLVAQAHPPTLVLAVLPVIHAAGPYAAFWLLALATTAAAMWAGRMVTIAYFPSLTRGQRVLALLLVAGWQPVLAAVRDGQVSVLIGALIVIAWGALRRGREVPAGAALGLAAALKLYPALLLVPLLLGRHVRAAGSMALTSAAVVAVATAVAGPDTWAAYGHSARNVVDGFSRSADNLSILARLGPLLPGHLLMPAFVLGGLALVGFTMLMRARTGRTSGGGGSPAILRGTPGAFDERQWAAFTCLALLLSPVAWHHYVFALLQPLAWLLAEAWQRRGRLPLLAWSAAALVLSLPAGAFWTIWRAPASPDWLPAVVSPGLVILLAWMAVLRLRSTHVPHRELAAA